ncbi:hypothetical protein RRG08_035256 [Elysia crispata]|uniref:Uncharacterized protein n=1 Tax=Elysia crispata TaxID=231223 RepID=A0AAE1AS30_9GAST|nr:hypothetical protein RRG08_035256 [Elysia crispata]
METGCSIGRSNRHIKSIINIDAFKLIQNHGEFVNTEPLNPWSTHLSNRLTPDNTRLLAPGRKMRNLV